MIVSDRAPQPIALATVHITTLTKGGLHSGKVASLASLKEAFLKRHGHQSEDLADCC